MANISYTVSRWDVSCEASDPTKICSVVLGITAEDSESGKSAYKDERISVPCQDLAEFEAGAEAFIEGVLGSQGWYLELQTRIANQMTAPVAAPENRDKPDFASMTIGDGYQDLPSEESSEESSSEEESSEESTEEAPAEEESSEEESSE
ncbi:MAG: hypothetical protein CMC15_14590 [Flavobacteriaceae bacterium]|nr:hypothetical protein [Flavobacteriaceae bacterium]